MAETGIEESSYRPPGELEPHPMNDDIYGDRAEPDEGLISSIERHGVVEPVVVDPQPEAGNADDAPTIISGHRRVEAAKEVGLEEVPVREVRLDSDLDRRERLLTHNRNRDKSFSQKLREATELERIERERARRRQGTRTDLVENSPQSEGESAESTETDFGKTRDKVGEKVGIGSGRTYQMAKKVWNASQEGDVVARHEVDKLDRGEQSIYGAYQKVRHRLQEDSEEEATADGDGVDEDTPDASETPQEDDREQVSPDDAVLSAHVGRNDDVLPEVLDLHVEPGSSIADVTYGDGVFWRKVPSGKYDLTATDIDPGRSPDSTDGVDCRDLPYEDGSLDCVVLDPPYAEGFYETEDKPSDHDFWIKDRYMGGATDYSATYHEAVLEMYAAAGAEAYRVLREGGVLIAKMQDEVSRNEQRLTHIEVTEIYEENGFHAEDLFVVVRPDTPTLGRMYEQRRARKNHSYFMVYVKED